jgi:hypothetical protein
MAPTHPTLQGGVGQAAEAARIALTRTYGEELESVEVFKYLGQLLAYNDNDFQTMGSNLKKVRKSWVQVSCVFRPENASPKVCGVFFTRQLYRQCYYLGVKH